MITDKNNVAPVLGFAYTPRFSQRLFGQGQTVIRGGLRTGYDEIANVTTAAMSFERAL